MVRHLLQRNHCCTKLTAANPLGLSYWAPKESSDLVVLKRDPKQPELATNGLWFSPEFDIPLTMTLRLDIDPDTIIRAKTTIPNRSLTTQFWDRGISDQSIMDMENGMDAVSNVQCLNPNVVV